MSNKAFRVYSPRMDTQTKTQTRDQPEDLSEGWRYEGILMAAHPVQGTVQVASATKSFPSEDGGSVLVTVRARTREALSARALEADRTYARPGPSDPEVLISRKELARVLSENARQARQITELQQGMTLKEEQLRAHRRVPLTDEQAPALKRDLEETTNAVLAKYAPKSDPPPPPKGKSGEFLVVCPSCSDRAKTAQ